jgi:hypothetical protein
MECVIKRSLFMRMHNEISVAKTLYCSTNSSSAESIQRRRQGQVFFNAVHEEYVQLIALAGKRL